jgi:hypothetical protein
MKNNGRRNPSYSLYDRDIAVIKRLASEAGLTDSEILRGIILAVSDCKATWSGPLLRFERPRFRWGDRGEGRFL